MSVARRHGSTSAQERLVDGEIRLSHRALRCASFYSYFMIGIFLTLVGPIIPAIREEFLLSHGAVARVFIYQSVGLAVAVLIGGAAADRYDRKRLIVCGFLFVGASMCAFALVGSWGATLLLFLLVGLGFGLGETVLNALFIDLSRGAAGKGLNALHTAPALGGITGALFASLLLPFGWRAPLVTLGVLLVAGAVWFGAVAHPEQSKSASIRLDEVRTIALHPGVLMVGVLLAAYVGVEGALNGWIVTYAMEALGGTSMTGALVTSTFWFGLAAGRAVCSRLARTDRQVPILIWSSVGACLAYLPILLLPSLLALTGSAFAIGLTLGGVFPTAVAHASAIFPQRVGAVTGYIFAWCIVGGALLPAGIGAIADGRGMQTAMAAVWIGALGVTVCALALARLSRPQRSSSLE